MFSEMHCGGVRRNKVTEVPAVADRAEAMNSNPADQLGFAIAATLLQHKRLQKGIAGTSLRLFRPTKLKEPGWPLWHLAVTRHVRIYEGPRVNAARLKYCDTTTGNQWQTGNTNLNLNQRDRGLLSPSFAPYGERQRGQLR